MSFHTLRAFYGDGDRDFAVVDVDGDGDLDVIKDRIWLNTNSMGDPGIEIRDRKQTVIPGEAVQYDIDVRNDGSAVDDVLTQITFTDGLENVSWICRADGDATCPSSAGNGEVSTTLSLPEGGRLHFVVDATVTDSANEVVVAASVGLLHGQDSVVLNNSVVDRNYVGPNLLSASHSYQPRDEPISIEFSSEIDASSVGGNINVTGNQSGRFDVVAIANGRTLTIELQSTPRAGEQLHVEVTEDVVDTEGNSMAWDWMLKASSGGQGRFRRIPMSLDPVSSHRDAAFGDLDGDGDLDMVLASDSRIEVWESTGIAEYRRRTLGPFDGTSANDFGLLNNLELADRDGDGDLDLYLNQTAGGAEAWLNIGGLQFVRDESFIEEARDEGFWGDEFLSGTIAPVYGDIDGDGDLDRVVFGGVETNDGAGNYTLTTPASFVDSHGPPGFLDPVLHDFDFDGDLDVMSLMYSQSDIVGAFNNIWINDGQGAFRPIVLSSYADNLESADFDGDMHADFVTSRRFLGSINFGQQDPDGDAFLSFNEHPQPPTLWEHPNNRELQSRDLDAADIDNDGDIDLVQTSLNGIEFLINEDFAIGDIDLNGEVGFEDFLFLSREFGKESIAGGEVLAADLSGNDIVDFADFLIVSQNFGNRLVASPFEDVTFVE